MKRFSVVLVALFALSAQAKEMFCVDYQSDGGFYANYNVACSEDFLKNYKLSGRRQQSNNYVVPGYSAEKMKAKAVNDLAQFGIVPLAEIGKQERKQIYARGYDDSQPRDLCLMLIDSNPGDHFTHLIGCTEGTEITITEDPSNLQSFGAEELLKSGFEVAAYISTVEGYGFQIFSRKR